MAREVKIGRRPRFTLETNRRDVVFPATGGPARLALIPGRHPYLWVGSLGPRGELKALATFGGVAALRGLAVALAAALDAAERPPRARRHARPAGEKPCQRSSE